MLSLGSQIPSCSEQRSLLQVWVWVPGRPQAAVQATLLVPGAQGLAQPPPEVLPPPQLVVQAAVVGAV